MNQEFPLSTNPQNPGDFWTQGPATPTTAMLPYAPPAPGRTGGSQSAKPSPMQKIHRLLRGRYPAAIVLAAMCAVAGGAAGYMALPPKYEADGFVEVSITVAGMGGENIQPMLSMAIATQVGLIAGEDVADLALKDPDFIKAWDDCYPNVPLPSKADMVAATDPEHVKNGALIKVAFTDKKKEVAEAGCKAMLKAYMALHGDKDGFSLVDTQIAYNTDKLTTAKNTLTYEETTLGRLREKYGSVELDNLSNKMLADLSDLERQVDSDKNAYTEAEAALQGNAAEVRPMTKEDVYNQIAALPNRQMQILLQNWEDAKQRLRLAAEGGLGVNHPRYKLLQLQVDAALREVDDYAREYLATRGNQLPGATLNEHVTPEIVAQLKQRYLDRKAAMEDMKEKAKDLGYQMDQIAKTRETIRTLQIQINGYLGNIAALEAKKALNRLVNLVDGGGEAQVPTDKRKLVASVGFAFGGILPIGLMLLYGLTENRYRFSDDANEHDMLGTTLLGILPNLPDRLSDPQQAGVAAHCVHQIRTMLQISRSNDEPQVLAITSASSGDGKTSLCLALGLSYAACGARTLLVDCDLVAAGLTHRLNVNSTDGVLEAVANRALLEYVRTTDIADVAILPVGTTHAHHASTLSPVALRRLISEGKKHFDIIIIDTGPLLGSIEASLVCAAADRSILAVARNQQRPLVERSIRHLQEIGAHLAGVVFNRAHASDFERSMSGLALRSRPAPGAPGAPAGGPGNMAGSFKKKAG
jgi:capsular exopolysaccharide synthesis family protein